MNTSSPCLQIPESNYIAARPFNLTTDPSAPNGGWCWFQGERAIIDTQNPDGPLLLAATVAFPNTETQAAAGNINLQWRNLSTGEQGNFVLHANYGADDHNSAALWQRPDGRFVAMYAGHGNDHYSRWRISEPNNPAKWSVENIFKTPPEMSSAVTYSNLHPLKTGSGTRLLNLRRAFLWNPEIMVSDDNGDTWKRLSSLVRIGSGNVRPYTRFVGDGEKVHVSITDGHPNAVNTSIWHGIITVNGDELRLLGSDGGILTDKLTDKTAPCPSALTPVVATGEIVDGVKISHAWPCDMSLSPSGAPRILMTTRVEGDWEDHRFIVARWERGAWRKELLCGAGGYLYDNERDYTGLGAMHPNRENEVVISTPIDPRTNTSTGQYELYRGQRASIEATWRWTALTANSTTRNLRPVIPSWSADKTLVLWLRGRYNTYTNMDTALYGIELD